MQGTSRFSAIATLVLLLAFAGIARAQSVTSDPTATVKGRAPTIGSVTISGTPSGPNGTYVVDDVLTVSYTHDDEDGDADDSTATQGSIQWYSGSTPVGTVGSTTYTIAQGDVGEIITVKITPYTNQATSDPFVGTEIDSAEVSATEGGGYVTVPDGTKATSVAITGDAEVDSMLTAVPSCGEACVGVTYQWQIETAFNSGTYENITGATGKTYTPVGTDQKKKIQVIATNAP